MPNLDGNGPQNAGCRNRPGRRANNECSCLSQAKIDDIININDKLEQPDISASDIIFLETEKKRLETILLKINRILEAQN